MDKIPVRNLWLLMFYASELFRHGEKANINIEDGPDDIPDLVAELLVRIVEKRLKRNLSYSYKKRTDVLNRVRGRIDLLSTERHQLLARGKISCIYEDLTINTPRNRFVRAALEALTSIAKRRDLAHRCRTLANSLKQLGVTGEKPTRSEVSIDRFGRHDSDDQLMVAAAHLAFDLTIPTEEAGKKMLFMPDRESQWVRSLFEKAIGGFFDVVLEPGSWKVTKGKEYYWQIDEKSMGVDEIFPQMKTDVVLDNDDLGVRIIIDTKFTSILKPGYFRKQTLDSKYIYQMYAYLRSQEGSGEQLADRSFGLLLHPSVGVDVCETIVMQGHMIRFATVDLAASAEDIRRQLLEVIEFQKDLEC